LLTEKGISKNKEEMEPTYIRKRLTGEDILCYFEYARQEKKDVQLFFSNSKEEDFFKSWKDISSIFAENESMKELNLERYCPSEGCLLLPTTEDIDIGTKLLSYSSIKKSNFSVASSSDDHRKYWGAAFVKHLKTRRPSPCPDNVFLIFLDFANDLIEEVGFFRTPDVIYWCDVDACLEINYVPERLSLFVDSIGYSLRAQMVPERMRNKKEIFSHLAKNISLTN
jgi:hypothetical protein